MSWRTAAREHGDPLWKFNPAIRFATREEAEAYGCNLRERRGDVEDYTVEAVEGPATYVFEGGVARMLTPSFPHPYS